MIDALVVVAQAAELSPEKRKHFLIFSAVWIAWGFVAWFVVARHQDPVWKRRLWLTSIGISALALIAFSTYMMGRWQIALFITPFIALIVFLNIRRTKFCLKCGKMHHDSNWLTPAKFCPQCGALYERESSA